MKKTIAAAAAALLTVSLTVPALACPKWECQYDVNDYNCGCGYNVTQNTYEEEYSGYIYEYNEFSTYNQPIYCEYCGYEKWECVCDNETSWDYIYGSNECNGYGYGSGGYQMDHWANVRDECGNVISQVAYGANVQVIGQDCNNPDRVMIYDPATGVYGSVLSECVYGGYSWDGSGNNGYYNSYHEESESYGYDYDYEYNYGYSYGGYEECSYDYGYNYSGGSYGYESCQSQSRCAILEYVEIITIIKKYEPVLKGCGLL